MEKDARKVKPDSFQLPAMVVLKELKTPGHGSGTKTEPSPKVIQVANCTTVGHHLRRGLCERCPPGVTWLFCGGLNENCSSAAVRKTVVFQTLYDAVTVSSQWDTADNFPFRCF